MMKIKLTENVTPKPTVEEQLKLIRIGNMIKGGPFVVLVTAGYDGENFSGIAYREGPNDSDRPRLHNLFLVNADTDWVQFKGQLEFGE